MTKRAFQLGKDSPNKLLLRCTTTFGTAFATEFANHISDLLEIDAVQFDNPTTIVVEDKAAGNYCSSAGFVLSEIFHVRVSMSINTEAFSREVGVFIEAGTGGLFELKVAIIDGHKELAEAIGVFEETKDWDKAYGDYKLDDDYSINEFEVLCEEILDYFLQEQFA